MKPKTRTSILAPLLAAGLTSLSQAALVSFEAGTSAQVQTGFTNIGGTDGVTITGPASATSSGITLRLAGGVDLATATTKDSSGDFNSTTGLFTRDRGTPGTGTDTGTFSYSKLYRDFLTVNFMGIEFLGLAANTAYPVTFYSYDNNGNRTNTFTDITPGGTGNSGAVTYTAASTFGPTTPDSVFSTTVNATTDSSGRLFFSASGTGTTNVVTLNAVQINVPEPSSAALFTLPIALLLTRRKRSA